MLKTAFTPLIALALVCAGSTGCISQNPSVKPIQNVTVGQTAGEALLVSNATTSALILLPSQLHATDAEVTLAPGQSKRLEFALTEERNVGDNNVSEIVLDVSTAHIMCGRLKQTFFFAPGLARPGLPRKSGLA